MTELHIVTDQQSYFSSDVFHNSLGDQWNIKTWQEFTMVSKDQQQTACSVFAFNSLSRRTSRKGLLTLYNVVTYGMY